MPNTRNRRRPFEPDEHTLARRAASVPAIRYPASLPITDHRDELLAAIEANQVVIVAGETGSGKSTQLPKLCLELGRGVRGAIGHTQPRRLAARTVAERIADELEVPLGGLVGYTVRFTDRASDRTLVKLMTDGILLAELQRDRNLNRYDTLIVDEAHERSLNIDFILGYLMQLLPRRPDLKVIVTSATIDTERFSRHFSGAPVIEVSGRSYPVEIRYRPLAPEDEPEADAEDDMEGEVQPEAEVEPRDQITAICEAVDELAGEGRGDILVFLSGEREIRDTADALERAELRHTEIVPLYARLSAAEQHRVFQTHPGRRVVLATNVAETSLTVPGVRYVVDTGTARISRYNRRTKVQRLPIEPVSQASADQRAGRCGRVAPGVCIRLYSEEDYRSRPAFTEPEILRTNLASVILQMNAIGLGDIAAFPFVEPPESRNIKDGIALLEELGALGPAVRGGARRLTAIGRKLARLPLDPRLARMVLEAGRLGCVSEVLVIASALAIQDPRERPEDKREAATQMHARFKDPDSDFLSYLRMWEYLQQAQDERSSSQFRRLCRKEFLSYLRVREWQDVHEQLRRIARELGLDRNEVPAEPALVHQALLSGLLSHIGMRHADRREYLGARNARFAIAPGSVLFKRSPRWVMAGELVETNRMWGRVVARIQPEWAERAGAHLVKRSYTDPWWDRGRASAMTNERVTLYGLPLVTARRTDFGRIDPVSARETFIQRALVEGDWSTHHRFVAHNRELVEQVRLLEDRARRRDILVTEAELYRFFDDRVPDHVVSGRHFDSWWKRERTQRPNLLDFSYDDVVDRPARRIKLSDYPDSWHQGELNLPVSYRFAPGEDDDGVSVTIPLPLLHMVSERGLDWQVPGYRSDLVTALIRSLPKVIRRHFVPVPQYVDAFLERVGPSDGPLQELLERELPRMTGDAIPPGSWHLDQVPAHLRITFKITDLRDRVVATGKDLGEMRRRLAPAVRRAVADVAGAMVTERTGERAWSFGTLPRVVARDWHGNTVRAFPALEDEGESVGVRLFATETEQADAMWGGTRRLLLLTIPSPLKSAQRLLPNATRLALAAPPHASTAALLDDCTTAVVDDLLAEAGGPAWDADAFDARRDFVRAGVVDRLVEAVTAVAGVLTVRTRLLGRIDELRSGPAGAAAADVGAQVDRLVHPGFVTGVGIHRLADIDRYLRAAERRLERVPADMFRDRERMRRVRRLEARFDGLADRFAVGALPDEVSEIEWMLEELRVSVFAQELGTARPVSEQRIERELARLEGRYL